MDESQPVRVCVAVPTFRRPHELAELLRGVAAQVIPPNYHVDVFVIDNDDAASAAQTVENSRADFPFRLTHVHEPKPGLCEVRNRALQIAYGEYDFLAMVDDDEVPEPQWLRELLRVQATGQADAVIGPVPQHIPLGAPRWIRAGRFYELPSFPDGARIQHGYSGNCLLDARSLQRYGVVFDPTLNFSGGEDFVFFSQLRARGATLAYSARAVAHEVVPPSRLRASYIVALNFRRGNTRTICDRRMGAGSKKLALRALKASGRVALGLATLLPLAVFRGRTGTIIAVSNIAQGLGGLAGLGGFTYHAYSRRTSVAA